MGAPARAAAAAAAAGWLLAAGGCGPVTGRRPSPPPDPDLRIWVPPVVHWRPGTERVLRFAVENGAQRTVEVSPPDARGVTVAIFADAGTVRACGVEAADPPAGEPVSLGPGDQLPVRVDLGQACGDLPAGEYRYELSYRAPRAGGGTTSLQTRYGTVVIEGAPQRAVGRRAPEAPRRPAPGSP